ncbi:MAG: hypothetical protein KA110_10880 [Acidimicrobiia bacterium]|jgi:hypothetical protein|nr:hypothetical protein [Acidimicrobiia bacterium]
MTGSELVGRTPYETWVLTLRAWGNDPMTPLDHLPSLALETFTPDTYQRLFNHLRQALQSVTTQWSDDLGKTLRLSQDRFALGHDLVQLRTRLTRRVQLVSHPSLPAEARDSFTKQTAEDIARSQQQIVDHIQRQANEGHLSRTEAEGMLDVVREHSFEAVMAFAANSAGQRVVAAPLREVNPTEAPGSKRWRKIRPFTARGDE